MQKITLATAAAAIALMAGCVDVDLGGPGATEHSTTRQAITVIPEFTIEGTEAIPESLYLTQLGLTVSEIRLEPLSTSSLAYTTRGAHTFRFDLSKNETVREGVAVELPHSGRYLVSIRLEPVATDGDEPSSFTAEGFVVDEAADAIGNVSDGEPQPMPFDRTPGSNDGQLTDAEAFPSEWTPFQYRSQRAVFYTFSDVEFEAGEQFLTFSFDLRDWAVDVVEPISNAVRANQTDDNVDVTKQVDSSGTGAQALIETGVVRTARRTPGQ